MFDLGTLGGATAQALAVNDAGYVTGYSEVAPRYKAQAPGRHAFVAEVSTSGKIDGLLDLGTLGGSFSYGTAISEKGQVVGYSTLSENGDGFHAFLYENGRMRDLGSLAQDDVKTNQSFAFGVNTAGHVVGYALLPLEQGAETVGFVYRDDKMQDLNQLIGGAAKRYLIYTAEAINERGQIAATAFDRENGVFHAVLLSPVELIGRE